MDYVTRHFIVVLLKWCSSTSVGLIKITSSYNGVVGEMMAGSIAMHRSSSMI